MGYRLLGDEIAIHCGIPLRSFQITKANIAIMSDACAEKRVVVISLFQLVHALGLATCDLKQC